MEELISVIVPVYNTAQYIRDCVKSVLEQSHASLELLLIDDGSNDDSVRICEALADSDHRICLLHQDHRGVSAARNEGIRRAKGKYLFFLDSDDKIHTELLKNLYVLLEQNDTVMATEYYCSSDDYWEEQLKWTEYFEPEDLCTYLSNRELAGEFVYERYGGFSGIGGKMVRRDMAELLYFDETLTNGEDTKFIYQLSEQGADAAILHKQWYYYRKHDSNASKSFTVPAVQGRLQVIQYIRDRGVENGNLEQAVIWERYFVKRITEWYVSGRETRNEELMRYAKQLAEEEKRRELFRQIDQRVQKDFYLAFYRYPIHWIRKELLKGLTDGKETQKLAGKKGYFQKKVRKNLGIISVVIPIYNAERYIRQCLWSVHCQTYVDLEIIVIDDGSTDRSLEICKEMGEKDSRIVVFSQERGGMAAARNHGLDIATGKYVFFLEGEDAIHPLLLEELIRQAATNLTEITFCEFAKVYAQWLEKTLNMVSEVDERPEWQTIERSDSEEWFHTKYEGLRTYLGALFLRKFIGTLRFGSDLFYEEDPLFLYRLICKQARITYSPKEWYYYRMSPKRLSNFRKGIDQKDYRLVCGVLRDSGYQRGYYDFALLWERRMVWIYRREYSGLRRKKQGNSYQKVWQQAVSEKDHVLFRKLAFPAKALFLCCFYCYPLYFLLEEPMRILDKIIWSRRR